MIANLAIGLKYMVMYMIQMVKHMLEPTPWLQSPGKGKYGNFSHLEIWMAKNLQ